MYACLSLFLTLIIGVQQAPYILDLVNSARSSDVQIEAIPETDRLYPVPPPAQPTHGFGVARAPFEVVSLLFDKTSYVFGEEYQCELTLRYIHEASTTFPIETQAHLFRRSMSGARAIDIAIVMDQPETGNQVISTEILFGAPSVVGSLVSLSQGQQIRLHMRGVWRLQKGASGATWPLQIAPKIEIAFADASVVYAPTQLPSDASLSLARAQ